MTTPTSTLGKFFHGLARLYCGLRSVVLNLLFIFLFLVFIGSLIGQPPVIVQRGSALLLNLEGVLVDQLTFVDPLDALMADSLGADLAGEILLQDLLDTIDYAATDADISAIVLVLSSLEASGFSKLQEVGAALDRFRAGGKKVYAFGDNYTQGQYYVAAHADEIILNTLGSVGLEGFSTYQLFYRDALDKLGVNVHIFRVGEYKSAVEPFERNDMSPEAREANLDWLGDLWRQYVADVSAARGLEPGFIDALINNLDTQLAEFGGDMAALATARNLVDTVMDRGELNDYLEQSIGPGTGNREFLYIGYDDYRSARDSEMGGLRQSNDQVGIIVASGTIYDGRRRAGEVGGDSLQDLVRRAREDDDIKALVLRVDSGGGSAFASEVIRSELEKLTDAGKPLVVSMGSVAASGGYWIATPADEIWASASTITGSIGIFGLYPTFEDSFAKLGLSTDGVGTTALAGAMAVGRELPALAGNVLQLTLEDGYRRFITLVAESRNMTLEEVDALARGRVWSGEDALALGLVDNLGNLEDAVAAAAARAGLESWEPRLIEQPLTPGQQLIQDLANSVQLHSLFDKAPGLFAPGNLLGGLTRQLEEDLKSLVEFNDPNGVYLHCQECLPVLSR